MTAARRPHVERRGVPVLTVDGLGVDRGGRRVVSNVSFTLSGGQALIVTGRNGAGKSTLLRALAGLLPRAEGEVTLSGGPPDVDLPRTIHYLAHADGLKAALTVEENLTFWADYFGAGEGSLAVADALEAVGLAHLFSARAGALSAGQKRRVALARLLVAHRPIWLLDEPLTALDAASRARFSKLMCAHCATDGMIVAATHEPLGIEDAIELKLGAAPAEKA